MKKSTTSGEWTNPPFDHHPLPPPQLRPLSRQHAQCPPPPPSSHSCAVKSSTSSIPSLRKKLFFVLLCKWWFFVQCSAHGRTSLFFKVVRKLLKKKVEYSVELQQIMYIDRHPKLIMMGIKTMKPLNGTRCKGILRNKLQPSLFFADKEKTLVIFSFNGSFFVCYKNGFPPLFFLSQPFNANSPC